MQYSRSEMKKFGIFLCLLYQVLSMLSAPPIWRKLTVTGHTQLKVGIIMLV